jgi:serine/threonine-protein kinase HipA
MTSKNEPNEAYVWIWLPNEVKPVVAGLLIKFENQILFNYGKSYLSRSNAIAIYAPELPLKSGTLPPLPSMSMPSCIRDASPDAWGRRVIINKKLSLKGRDTGNSQLDELTYLLESGSDRIGALDFQLSPTTYAPRGPRMATLEELLQSAEKVEAGILLSPELDQALYHGSSLGGARPKAFIESENKKFIAKFSSSTDAYSIVKAEFVAMRLAKIAGLDVASVKLAKAAHKDILLVERFDRKKTDNGWTRKAMVSALTMLELDEMMARYASYEDLAEIIRHRFTSPTQTLKELFGRIVFNVLCGNTDDHARNHAAFWDGNALTLTPAYDICPQNRSGNEASQAMIITQSGCGGHLMS